MARRGPVLLFLAPIAVLLFTRLFIEVVVRFVPLDMAWIPSFLVYYLLLCISCLLLGRPFATGILHSVLSFRPFPERSSLLVGVALPPLMVIYQFYLIVGRVPPVFIIPIVAFALINSVAEESFWRGLLVNLQANRLFVMLYSAILFGFSHYFLWGSYWFKDPLVIILMTGSTLVMGLVWMWFQQREQRLLYVILSHFLVDLLNLGAYSFYRLGRFF